MFKVGDIVRISSGDIGKIEKVVVDAPFPYKIRFSDGCGWASEANTFLSSAADIDVTTKTDVPESNVGKTPAEALHDFREAVTKFQPKTDESVTKFQNEPHILDSGARTEYGTGAVRDIKEGKGRCDLMPINVVADLLKSAELGYIYKFKVSGDFCFLMNALREFSKKFTNGGNSLDPEKSDCSEMFLEVSKHYEEGAIKYGEYNWQKGIPIHSYIDSAVRHYLKYKAGWKDEPHDRAFVWNLMCCIWTMQHKPELDDFTNKQFKIIFRPQRGGLEESMKEAREFKSIDEMKQYVSLLYSCSCKDDVEIDERNTIDDKRTGWKNSRYVFINKDGKQMNVGICATEY